MVTTLGAYGEEKKFGSRAQWRNVFQMRDARKRRRIDDEISLRSREDSDEELREMPPCYATTEIVDLDRLTAYTLLKVDKKQATLEKFHNFVQKQPKVDGSEALHSYVVNYYKTETSGRRYAKGKSAQKLSRAGRAACFAGHSIDIDIWESYTSTIFHLFVVLYA